MIHMYILSGAVNIWPFADTPFNMISFLTCHISFYHISFYTGMLFSMIYLMANHKGCPKKNCFTEFEGNVGRLGFLLLPGHIGLFGVIWLVFDHFGLKIWSPNNGGPT